MLIKDIPKDHAEDYALYQLGLSQNIPCSIEIKASEDEITELADEVLHALR